MDVQFNQQPNPYVPGAYILNLPPGPIITPAVTNQIDIVGAASWGPVNSVAAFGPNNGYALYGPPLVRSYDLMSWVAVAALAGGQNFRGVRVTDSTDVAATVIAASATVALTTAGAGFAVNDTITFPNGAVVKVSTISSSPSAGTPTAVTLVTPPSLETSGSEAQSSTSGSGTGASYTFTYTTGATFTSKYSGSLANTDTVQILPGSAASSLKVIVARVGQTPEVFDNIVGTGLAAWTNIVSAINNGTVTHGPSNYVVATVGTSTTTPLGTQTYTLTGGTDGASGVNNTNLLGVDGTNRTGMYAFRGTGPAMLLLTDCTSAAWATMESLCIQEGFYGIVAGTSGEYTNLATVAANKASAGVDTYGLKVMVGDYLYFYDTYNGIPNRLVQPCPFMAGELSILGPQQSSLNKAISGIVGSQSSLAGHVYSTAEIQVLGQSQLDLIANPCPGGNYFGAQQGTNASSNAAINGDNYTRMAAYLDYSFASVAGQFVGRIQTVGEQQEVLNVFDNFLNSIWKSKPALISNPQGTQPFQVLLGATPTQQAQGYQILNIAVQLGPIIRIFQVNVTVGQTVQIMSATNTPAS